MINRWFLGCSVFWGSIAAGCGSDNSTAAGPEFQPLESHFEDEGEGPFIPCTPADFDADACEAAVNPPAP